MKQVLATYIPLPGTNKYWFYMRKHGCNSCGVRTYDPEVARQTPYPLGHHSHKEKSLNNKFQPTAVFKHYVIIILLPSGDTLGWIFRLLI